MAFDAALFEIDPTTLTTVDERRAYLRDFLRALPDSRFDLRSLYRSGEYETSPPGHGFVSSQIASPGVILHDCGTAACIAGWAVALFTPNATEPHEWDATGAGALLGLSASQGERLFTPPGFTNRELYPRSLAVAVLDHLVNTGEVDWSKAAA